MLNVPSGLSGPVEVRPVEMTSLHWRSLGDKAVYIYGWRICRDVRIACGSSSLRPIDGSAILSSTFKVMEKYSDDYLLYYNICMDLYCEQTGLV